MRSETADRWQTGERVLVRGRAWTIVGLTAFAGCDALRLSGAGPGHAGDLCAHCWSPSIARAACTVLVDPRRPAAPVAPRAAAGGGGRAPRRRVEADGPERHRNPAVSAGTRARDDCPGRSAPDDCGRRRPREDHPGGDRPRRVRLRARIVPRARRRARGAPRAMVAGACRSFRPPFDGGRRGVARAKQPRAAAGCESLDPAGHLRHVVRLRQAARSAAPAGRGRLGRARRGRSARRGARDGAPGRRARDRGPIETRPAADGDAARGRREPVRGLVPHRRNLRPTAIG